MKVCPTCRVTKPPEAFHRHRGRPDGRQRECRDCKAIYNAQYYEQNESRHRELRRNHRSALRARVAEVIRSYKDRPCLDSGRILPPEAMDLDHVRGVKAADGQRMRGMGLRAVLDELRKCEVVCVNCHRLRTWHRARRVALMGEWWVPSESNRQPFG